MSHDFKATVEGTKASELETGHLVRDIKPGVVTYHLERPDGSTFENKVMNFNNTICQYKKNIIFLGAAKIYRARLLSWREFIDKLKFTDNHDWLTVLKVALEIYNGEIKGFALLPDAKERRQSFLKDYMKKLILTSIQTVIFKFKTNYDGANSQSDSTHNDSDEAEAAEEKDFSIDKIAIKVSIEFCLQIGEADYLFGEIYRFFVEKDLEDKFISHLCAPIIAGQFRSERIPESILHKLVRMYEDRQEFKVLEKYVKNTHGSTHTLYKLEIEDIFKVERKGEAKRFKPFRKMHNRQLLWHGSRTTNYAGILSQVCALTHSSMSAPIHTQPN